MESEEVQLRKAEERIEEACRISKRFKGFRVKAVLVKRWFDAQNCIKQHQMQDALKILSEVERGVKATLVGFFRFSPSFFDNAFQPFLFSSSVDLRQKADEAMKKLSIFTTEKWIDLEKAAELYQNVLYILKEFREEEINLSPRRQTFSVRPRDRSQEYQKNMVS